jgi:hypothetical protein
VTTGTAKTDVVKMDLPLTVTNDVSLGSITCNISKVNGTAFITNPSVDLTPYVGHKITLTAGGKTVVGWIKAAGTSEGLGDELVDVWTNHGTYPYSTLTLGVGNLITQAVASTTGSVYKSSSIAGMLIKNTNAWTKTSGENPIVCIATVSSLSNVIVFTANDTSYKTVGGQNGFAIYNNNPSDFGLTAYSSKQVTAPSATGVTIVSTQGGSNYNWTSDDGIDCNAASVTAVISDVVSSLSAPILTVTINKSTTAAIGELVIGNKTSLGTMKYSPQIGITDYSTKTQDTFGNWTITVRGYSKRLSCNMRIANTSLDSVFKTLSDCRSLMRVWVGDSDYSCLIVYGFYKDFQIVIPYKNWSDCNLEIEGMI